MNGGVRSAAATHAPIESGVSILVCGKLRGTALEGSEPALPFAVLGELPEKGFAPLRVECRHAFLIIDEFCEDCVQAVS